MLTPTLSSTSTDTFVDADPPPTGAFDYATLKANDQVLQERIRRLQGETSPTRNSPFRTSPPIRTSPPREHDRQLEQQLRGEIESLQAQLRSRSPDPEMMSQLRTVKHEREMALLQASTVRNEVTSIQRTLDDKQAKLDSVSASHADLMTQVNVLTDSNRDSEARMRDLNGTLEEKQSLIETLKQAVDAKSSKEGEAANAVKAKEAEISLLEARNKRAAAEFEEERKELMLQVDELRKAGQVHAQHLTAMNIR